MHFIHIDSVDDERLRSFTHLTEPQLRNRLEPSMGMFIAESPKVIDRALASMVEPVSFLVEKSWLQGMSEEFAFVDQHWGSGIPVYIATSQELQKITGYRLHRGTLATMRRWPLPSVEQICQNAHRIAVMEDIVDPTNIGALMRSAAALNIDAVLVTPSCGDPLYRRAARVSMGTVFQVPWTRIGGDDRHYWPWQGLKELTALGFTTAALALSNNSISMDELVDRLNGPSDSPKHVDKLAMIFGTEGDGLSRHTIDNADLTVKIPMSNGVDSLNVAASSAVAFWATRRIH